MAQGSVTGEGRSRDPAERYVWSCGQKAKSSLVPRRVIMPCQQLNLFYTTNRRKRRWWQKSRD